MATMQYDLIVIGSGPGGYVGAIRASQLGLKVALVEKSEWLGGTCLNVGCIPTKSLLHSAKTWDTFKHAESEGFSIGSPSYDWKRILARKDGIVDAQRKGLRFLMKKNKIEVLEGHGRIAGQGKVSVTDKGGKKSEFTTKSILIATGSRVRELPFAKTNGKNILSSDHILFIEKVPESLVIVGGGVVGMEFASLFGRMGTKVTVIELAPRIIPFEDAECSAELAKQMKGQNVTIETGTKLSKVEDKGDHCLVTVEGGEPRKFSKVLMSTGREPVTDDIGLNTVGLTAEKGGFLAVDDHYRTKAVNIYAIGDVIPTPALAHTASAEAIHAAEHIAGHEAPLINYHANPSAIYTYPEVASIGMSEEKLKEKGIEYKSGKFPFSVLAKARIENATVGFVKILFEPKYREILGVHIVGNTATEMIAEFALGKILETTVDEIAHTIHPHPTLSETIMEAAHMAIGAGIHL